METPSAAEADLLDDDDDDVIHPRNNNVPAEILAWKLDGTIADADGRLLPL